QDSWQSSPKNFTRSRSSHDDLKSRLQFSSMTDGGVKKGPTFMHIVSNHKTGARWSFGQKGPSTLFSSNSSPPPGTYNLPSGPNAASGGKYKKPPNFSFGGSSRFALGPNEKKQPGPGAYNPKDPLLTAGPKVSFTGANAGRGLPLQENAPGPGAYEQRSSLGKSKMFTARGRQANAGTRSRSQPGPGAYDPKVNAVLMGIPRCGFGTATRADITGAASSLFGPGPGAYDLQNAMSLGKNGPKYSATSRRRVHDLDSYVTPGPGTYNAHTTSFVPGQKSAPEFAFTSTDKAFHSNDRSHEVSR
ncbi:Pumilio-like 2, partial [Durusdinium trenchii]